MLIDVVLIFAVYMGIRLNDYLKTTKSKSMDVKPTQQIKPSKTGKDIAVSEAEKRHKYYSRMTRLSEVSMGLSAVRQFIFPALAPISLGLFIYTSIPLMRAVEKLLVKERRVNVDVLFFLGDVLTLALGQYLAAAFELWMFHSSKQTVEQTKSQSEKLLLNVFEQQPQNVWLLKDHVELETSLEEIKANDILVVNTGEVIPVDGIVTEGMATVDQRALTGESQPAEKEVGERVFASTLVITGKIYVKVEQSMRETTIAKIGQFLTHTSHFKSNIQLKGETWANQATLPMFLIAGIMLPTLGAMSTVVFIRSHIGNRIRFLAPLGTLNYLALASHKGILVKDGRVFELLIHVDTILFDKTGTLTHEQPEVGKIIVNGPYESDEILTYAAAAERKFTHPIAKAILQKADDLNLTLPEIEEANYQMGYGVTVHLGNQNIQVGSARFMTKEGIIIPDILKETQTYLHDEGSSLVLVAVDHQIAGAIEIQPQVREEMKQIISGLRQRGIKHIAIVSGDHKQPTQKLAQELGMDSYFYEVLPEKKADIVEQLQKEGKSVCFVGDGINDAIAMKKANVSISLRGASSIATDTAEVVLMDGSLSHLCDFVDMAKNLDANLHNSLVLSLVPSGINLSGSFLFHFNILTALIVNTAFVVMGMINANNPLKEIEKIERENRSSTPM
jgi:Cu2+-exporting ATPase